VTVASWSADVPEGVDFAWCPNGCGRPTDDPYGGPCKKCWDRIGNADAIDFWETDDER
jgi:hypothetical protein